MYKQQSNTNINPQYTHHSCLSLTCSSPSTPLIIPMHTVNRMFNENTINSARIHHNKQYNINSHSNNQYGTNAQMFWKKLRQIQKNKFCTYCYKSLVNENKDKGGTLLKNRFMNREEYGKYGTWVAAMMKASLDRKQYERQLQQLENGHASSLDNSKFENTSRDETSNLIQGRQDIDWKYYTSKQCWKQVKNLIHYYRFLQYIPALPTINHNADIKKYVPYIMLARYRSKINMINYQQIRKELLKENKETEICDQQCKEDSNGGVGFQSENDSEMDIGIQDSLQLNKGQGFQTRMVKFPTQPYHNKQQQYSGDSSIHELLLSMGNDYNKFEQIHNIHDEHGGKDLNICKLIEMNRDIQFSEQSSHQQEYNDSREEQQGVKLARQPKAVININYINNQNKKYNNVIINKSKQTGENDKYINICTSYKQKSKEKSKSKNKSCKKNMEIKNIHTDVNNMIKRDGNRNKIRELKSNKRYQKYSLAKSLKSDKSLNKNNGTLNANGSENQKWNKMIPIVISNKNKKKKKVHASCGNLTNTLLAANHSKEYKNKHSSTNQMIQPLKLVTKLIKNKQLHTQTQYEQETRTNQNNSHRAYTVINNEMLKPFSLTLTDFRDYLSKLKSKIHQDNKQQLEQEYSSSFYNRQNLDQLKGGTSIMYIKSTSKGDKANNISSQYPSPSMSPHYNYNPSTKKIHKADLNKNIYTTPTPHYKNSNNPKNQNINICDNDNTYCNFMTNSKISDGESLAQQSGNATGSNFNKNKKSSKNKEQDNMVSKKGKISEGMSKNKKQTKSKAKNMDRRQKQSKIMKQQSGNAFKSQGKDKDRKNFNNNIRK